jgi:hypothetical protein
VHLFRLVNGAWTYVRPLLVDIASNEGDGVESHGVDMRAGIIAAAMQPLTIFERVGADYVQRSVISTGEFRGDDVYVDQGGTRIVFGGACYGATVYAKQVDGSWAAEGFLPGDFCGSTDGASGGPVALSGPLAVVSNPGNDEGLPGPAVTSFDNRSGPWTLAERMVVPEGHAAGQVALLSTENPYMFVEDVPRFGTAIYLYNDNREWNRSVEALRSESDWMSANNFSGLYPHGHSVEATNDYVMRHVWDHDRQQDVVQVYVRGLNFFEHRATLVPSDRGTLTGRISISGRRVMLGGADGPYYFELPASLTAPSLIQDTFPGATAPGWTVLAGSQFSVVVSDNSRVFRQSSTAGDAGAVLNAADWTNQSIQADVKPTAVNGTSRWAGLATRRTDAANYYYVTLRSSGIVELKRMFGGSFQTLDSATLPFTLNRIYRLRLESIGTLHRVYVDGVRILEASDGDLAHGRAALLSYKMAADFDNVIVSPTPFTTIYAQDLCHVCGQGQLNPTPWDYHDGQWSWDSEQVFTQRSLTTLARAFAGAVTQNTDMTVEARMRVRAWGAGYDPWIGLMARGDSTYGDSYVYLALRRSNTVTLRRVYAGSQITQLGAAVFNVTSGAWYRVRLETVGSRIRAYINGRLVLEAVDNQAFVGSTGLVTYHAQADFDDFQATMP